MRDWIKLAGHGSWHRTLGAITLCLSVLLAGPVSGDVIQLAWFYKPPANTSVAQLSQNFETFILTHRDEDERNELLSAGTTMPLQYLRFDAIHAPCAASCPCAQSPYGNQVAFRDGDFCNLLVSRPDWFLRDSVGEVVIYADGGQTYAWMDPANEEWREFWRDRALELQQDYGWDGVFMDNVDGGLGRFRRRGIDVAQYSTDQEYAQEVAGFLSFLDDPASGFGARRLFANITELEDEQTWFDSIQYLDGAMQESFAVDWSDGYIDSDEWLVHIERAEQSLALNKELILVSQGAEADSDRQIFALASFLLIADGSRASFRYSDSSDYRSLWWFENYETELGLPISTRTLDNGVWRRVFQNGEVSVDPANNVAVINLFSEPPPEEPPPEEPPPEEPPPEEPPPEEPPPEEPPPEEPPPEEPPPEEPPPEEPPPEEPPPEEPPPVVPPPQVSPPNPPSGLTVLISGSAN